MAERGRDAVRQASVLPHLQKDERTGEIKLNTTPGSETESTQALQSAEPQKSEWKKL